MIVMIKRNLMLFFKDKASVFFSLLSVFIILGLYFLFLKDTMSFGNQHYTPENDVVLKNSWMMGGLVAVTTMSTTLGGLGVMINDRVNKITKDLMASPLRRSSITAGYILSAVVIGLIMSSLAFIFGGIYIAANGGSILPFGDLLKCMGVIILSTLASSSMITLIVIFIQTENAYGTVSSILGTLIGFVAGVYMPIGILPGIQYVIKCFPIAHSASLLRQIMMEDAMNTGYALAPLGTKEAISEFYGITFKFGSIDVTPLASVIFLIVVTIVFYGLSLLVLSRRKEA